ncbi:MAG: PqqD family protein [Gammaproteobacteria bacterium]|nr:PqqD family protein [Gammaproteobacteria bacterium]
MMCYKIQDDLLLQKVVDETVILDPESGDYFSLDEIGSRMIELFKKNGSVKQAVKAMAEEYSASEADIERDMIALLDEMVQHGIVDKVES